MVHQDSAAGFWKDLSPLASEAGLERGEERESLGRERILNRTEPLGSLQGVPRRVS